MALGTVSRQLLACLFGLDPHQVFRRPTLLARNAIGEVFWPSQAHTLPGPLARPAVASFVLADVQIGPRERVAAVAVGLYRLVMAASFDRLLHVLLASAERQVARIHAGRIVAGVQNLHAIRDRTDDGHVHQPMRVLATATESPDAVAGSRAPAGPFKATCGRALASP